MYIAETRWMDWRQTYDGKGQKFHVITGGGRFSLGDAEIALLLAGID
jgi:hypothetical protein